MKNTATPDSKINKSKGPFRTEAIVPVLFVSLLAWAYFHFIFDRNLKSILEYTGYEIAGAEVNIADLETSFLRASFRVKGIEVTNSEKPTLNLIKIGDIRYSVLWDGILRARFVVNEMAIEQIEFNTQRSQPGRVKPPEPPKAQSNEPSLIEKEANKLKTEALEKTKDQYSGNVLGDVATMLSGTSASDQLKSVEDSLPSKIKLKEFEKDLNSKQEKWQARIKSLPQGAEIQGLSDRLGRVKIRDFKSPQELQESIQQFDSIFKDAEEKIRTVQAASDDLKQDLKSIDQGYKEIDQLIKKDIKDLQARFKIPQIDANSISRSLFHRYLDPYLNMFNKYKTLSEKYIPPNLLKKNQADDSEIKPHPRAKGITYEFGKPNSYPLFWIKRISISSQAGATKDSGNIKGLITDITSNQKLIGRPTILGLEGNFPSMEISGFLAKLTIDMLKDESKLDYEFSVGSYPIQGRDLVNSPEAKISFKKAEGELRSKGSLLGLKSFTFALQNSLHQVTYDISAKNEVVDSILKEVFKGLPVLTIQAKGSGELPNLPLDLESNLGPELQKGLEKQLQKKIDEAKLKLQVAIDKAIGQEKAKIESEIAKLKGQLEAEIKRINAQLDSQKNAATLKADSAKKEAEQQAKKKIESEGQKTLDDLKKKFGL